MSTLSISKFDYYLPLNQVANVPLLKRDRSKLMYLDIDSSTMGDKIFSDIPSFIKKGDLIILNDTKVILGRMFLKKETGGIIEILFHKYISKNSFEVIFASSRPLKINSKLFYKNEDFFKVVSINKNYVVLTGETKKSIIDIFKALGVVPLPKYIKRPASCEIKKDIKLFTPQKKDQSPHLQLDYILHRKLLIN